MAVMATLNGSSSLAGRSSLGTRSSGRASLSTSVKRLSLRIGGARRSSVRAEAEPVDSPTGRRESRTSQSKSHSDAHKPPAVPTAAQWRELTRKTRMEDIDVFSVDGEEIHIPTYRPS